MSDKTALGSASGKAAREKMMTWPLTGCILLAIALVLLVCQVVPPRCRDRAAIAARYAEFYESLNSSEYEQAYSLMSPTYRQTHSLRSFGYHFDSPHIIPQLGTDHSITFSGNKAYLYPTSRWWLTGILDSGYQFELEKVEESWYFTGEYTLLLD